MCSEANHCLKIARSGTLRTVSCRHTCRVTITGSKKLVAEVFLDNFERYRQGRELVNRVDKTLGFVNT